MQTNVNNFFSIHLKTTEEIIENFLPFVKNGGLFIPTQTLFCLHEEIFLKLQILDEPFNTLKTKVVLINPASAINLFKQGVGVQFDDAKIGAALQNKIVGID